MQPQRTCLVMAGGTGGHVYPALAVAEALRARGWDVHWLGTKTGLEARVVPPAGFVLHTLPMSGLRGTGLFSKLLMPFLLLASFAVSLRLLLRLKPRFVLGMGGYPAFPGGMMASLLNRPLLIHEQNSVAGLTNRVLACLADHVLTAFPLVFTQEADKPIPCGWVSARWVGNPVREAIARLAGAPREARSGRLRLLVVGGSQGAAALNAGVPQALAQIPPERRPDVVHQAGIRHLDTLRQHYCDAGVEADVRDYIDDMAAEYAAADLVICRAGAMTVAELACAGVPAVLVPYPHAVDDHQTGNAKFLAEAQAAWLMPQDEMTPAALARLIESADRDTLAAMGERARRLARPSATEDVVALCEGAAR